MARPVAALIGEATPAIAVIYEPDEDATVAFFSVIFADAPPPAADDAATEGAAPVAAAIAGLVAVPRE